MKKFLFVMALGAVLTAQAVGVASNPAEDLRLYRSFFTKRFPGLPLDHYANGSYALDRDARDAWLTLEEFPPYEEAIGEGQSLWNKPFKNGRGFKDCFPGGPTLSKNYPSYDNQRKMVVTLPLAINECLLANGEEPLKYKKGKLASILAFVAFSSRGQRVGVNVIPEALEAYDKGKQLFFSRRGQLDLSCAHCHFQSAGQHYRTDTLSPALGQATHWPVYRSTWGEMGTLHRRFAGCNALVGAKPFKEQSEEYRNLELFLTHMSNGLPFNGPSSRK